MKTFTLIAIVTGLGVWAFYNHLVLVVISSATLFGVVAYVFSLHRVLDDILGKGWEFGIGVEDSKSLQGRIRILEDEIKDARRNAESRDALDKTIGAECRILRDAISRIDRTAIRTFEAIVEEDRQKEQEYFKE